MRLYLNVYDYPVDHETLEALRTFGWEGLRRDVTWLADIQGILAEGNQHQLETILLFNRPPSECVGWAEAASRILGPEQKVEIGNEWDLKYSPEQAKDCWLRCQAFLGPRMITGGISSLSDKALAWASKALHSSFENVGFHPYRTTKPPDRGVIDRINILKAMVPNARLWNTDCGWHTCKSRTGCFSSVQFSEVQVAEFLQTDIRYHEEADVESYTVYQLNDGPNPCPDYESHFGIRRVDGSWKPSARTKEL